MKVYFQLALFTALAFLLWLPALALDQVPEVDSITVNKWIAERKDLVVIDVGSPGDFAEGHIGGSILLPINGSFIEKSKSLPKGKTYVLVCPTGGRSVRAAKLMIENGFEHVYNLRGGIADWLRKGFKVIRGNE
jgi:rhodanese-related sulfurtransferase